MAESGGIRSGFRRAIQLSKSSGDAYRVTAEVMKAVTAFKEQCGSLPRRTGRAHRTPALPYHTPY
jgi:hypothetical protein